MKIPLCFLRLAQAALVLFLTHSLHATESLRLYLAGDSTMAAKAALPENAERGWGEALAAYFTEAVAVENRALNGRSTVSFRAEGHWQKILDALEPGDWVLIQFGHNDEKENNPSVYAAAEDAYPENLRRFVEEIRARGAEPILATPIVRRRFEGGTLVPTHGAYPDAVRKVAKAAEVPLLEMTGRTREAVKALGPDQSRALYLWSEGGRYARFPDGVQDDTHLSARGAAFIAGLAVAEMQRLDLALARHLKDPVPDLVSVNWQPLYPEGPPNLRPDAGEAVLEDGRASNIHHPVLGVFPAWLGEGPRPAVIVSPGGGYARLAMEHEGHEVARWLNSIGVNAFVLKYRLKEYGYPAPLQDVLRALRTVRAHAAEWNVDPERIGVLGFSAGGHVTGMAATLWDSDDGRVGDPLDEVSARPDFAALIYPVITMDERYTHAGSRSNLIGDDADESQVEALSLENWVTESTPPVFLVHGADDEAVPAENSLRFAQALLAHDVPVEWHLFPRGPHGFGMNRSGLPIDGWTVLLADWMKARGLLPLNDAAEK